MDKHVYKKAYVILILSLAHLINDLYCNFLPQIMPFLTTIVGLSVLQVSGLVSTFAISSSLIQPLFGYYLDKQGKRWMVYLGLLWMSILLSLTGFINNYLLLITVTTLAGLGSAAFHPQASAIVNSLSKDQNKGFILSVFSTIGNFGFAASPLLIVPLFQRYGVHASILIVIPSLIFSILLYIFIPKTTNNVYSNQSLGNVINSLKHSSKELTTLIIIIALRSLCQTGILAFLPLYFETQNIPIVSGSRLVFYMLFAGVIGGILGGIISDKVGRKPLIIVSLILSTPIFYGFLYTDGIVSSILLIIAGALLLSSFSVTIVAAQVAIPQNKSLAAGLSMGFASGIGNLAVVAVGWIGEFYSLKAALILLFSFPLLAGGIGFFMKETRKSELYT